MNLIKKLFAIKEEVQAVNSIITPFDDEVMDKLKHTYINGLPVLIFIKYLMAVYGTKRCEYMAYALDDIDIVCGNIKKSSTSLERTFQGWIEKDGFVYDTVTLMKYDSATYYRTYDPKDIVRYSKDTFLDTQGYRETNDEVRRTTLDDLRANGRKNDEFNLMVNMAHNMAKNKEGFAEDMNEFLNSVSAVEKTGGQL